MKRIKFTSVFLVAIILLVNLATLMVYSENGTHVIVNGTHVIVNGYRQYGKNAPSKSGDKVDVKIFFKNNSGEDLEDFYVLVDSSSAFYIDSGSPQIINIGGLEIGEIRPEKNDEDDNKIKLVYKGAGNELVLTLKYRIGGENCQTNQILYLETKEKKDSSGSGSFVDTSKFKPDFRILDGIKTVKGQDGKLTIKVPVKNITSYTAKDVTVTLLSDSENFPFMLSGGNISFHMEQLKSKTEGEVTLDLLVKPNAKTDTYPLTLEFRYYNTHGDYFTSTESMFVAVENNKKKPTLIVKDVKFNPSQPVAGDKANASFEFENTGNLDGKNIKVTLKGFNENGIMPQFTGVKHINSIKGGRNATADFGLIISKNIATENYPIEVSIEYEDDFGKSYTESYTYYIPVSKGSKAASIKIDEITSPRGSVAAEKDFSIGFDVVNDGSLEVSDIKVSIMTASEIICKSQSTMIIDSIEPGGAMRIEHELYALSDAATKNYPIEVNVEYESGGEKQNITRYIGVFVENDKDDEKDPSKISTPRLIIDQYSISTGEAVAGQSFEVKLGILNTHKNTTVSNIGVSLAADEGVFIPSAGGGSSIYIGEISPGERVERTVAFDTKFDAEPKSYSLKIDFEYEDENQNQHTTSESISIPVVQEHRLEASEIVVPPFVQVGQSFPVTLDFYNMGRSTLYNMMVKCEGNFDIQDANYFAGNFEPGRTDYYEAYITPTEPGEIKGAVIFTFEDSMGKSIEVKKEFEFFVEEMMDMGGDFNGEGVIFDEDGMIIDGGMMGASGTGGGILKFVVIAVVLIVAIVIAIIVIRKKRKKASADLYENY